MQTLLPAVTNACTDVDDVVVVVFLAELELPHAETARANRTTNGRLRTAARVPLPRLRLR
jgi:hypothetical protein